jgi:hypothetical protein
VVFGEPHPPFYKRVRQLVNTALERPDHALEDLKSRNILFYHEAWIRALFNYNTEDFDRLGIQGFVDLIAVMDEVKKYWHLPFRDPNK